MGRPAASILVRMSQAMSYTCRRTPCKTASLSKTRCGQAFYVCKDESDFHAAIAIVELPEGKGYFDLRRLFHEQEKGLLGWRGENGL